MAKTFIDADLQKAIGEALVFVLQAHGETELLSKINKP